MYRTCPASSILEGKRQRRKKREGEGKKGERGGERGRGPERGAGFLGLGGLFAFEFGAMDIILRRANSSKPMSPIPNAIFLPISLFTP
jgi:hypothetical protein